MFQGSFRAIPASSRSLPLEARQFRLHAVGQNKLGVYGVGTMLTVSPLLKDFPRHGLHVLVEGRGFGFQGGIDRIGDREPKVLKRDCHLGGCSRIDGAIQVGP